MSDPGMSPRGLRAAIAVAVVTLAVVLAATVAWWFIFVAVVAITSFLLAVRGEV